MKFSENPGTLKKFHRTPWKFQKTFQTPLNNLPSFLGAILSAHPQIVSGCLAIDQVVFAPKHLMDLLGNHEPPQRIAHGGAVTATGRLELETLLREALSDAIDFAFIPEPKAFGIYADHD
jgi:hypothetical protein